jgi:hypothetical protein
MTKSFLQIICSAFALVSLGSSALQAQSNMDPSPFRQMYDLLPPANNYRTVTGAPGHEYYQQQADYIINVELDDTNQRISGDETVTYHNNSPDVLTYIWIQLDQNQQSKESDSHKINPQSMSERVEVSEASKLEPWFDGGYKIEYVKDATNKDLKYTVNKTMMRIDLPVPMRKGDKFVFKIKYSYNINDRFKLGGRSGYEYFEEDKNYLYTIAQFFPRMCAYNDVEGWQHNQFLGSGEFTLIFGNYTVNITVPADHLVAATGTLQNADKVLSREQLDRFKKSLASFTQPVIIATQEEAIAREKEKSTAKKTWTFKADNVRDFAFASSRKFIWDAMAVKIGNNTSMAMSMYPKEGNPLWEKYSTKTVAHTLKTFSKFTVDYPYPVAWSINADRIGMEYPMICFNFGRCEKDGTYGERTKYGMISVIIHEVGHNFFPMIINSDERQWAWMDEGLTTFVQYLTEQEFERNYPSSRGDASKIVDYMAGDKSKISPIMMNPETVYQLGNNAYSKPATALNILRETVMGREAFDAAFKEYARRWAFKQPYPADFFRTMEDASGVDLDWFWRGWFYTNDHVDLAISDVKLKKPNPTDPEEKSAAARKAAQEKLDNSIGNQRNKTDIKQTYTERDTSLIDFYSKYDRYAVNPDDIKEYQKAQAALSPEEKKAMSSSMNYYEVEFERKGGLVMPIIYRIDYADGTQEVIRLPAEVWRKGETKVTRVHQTEKEISRFVLDPYAETADIDTENNSFPREEQYNKFEVFKRKSQGQPSQPNPMQKAKQQSNPKP